MITRRPLIAAGLLAIAGVWPCYSIAQVFTPCLPGATVRYVNGVGAPDEQSAADSADALKTEIAQFDVRCVARVLYLYNPSNGVLDDLLREVALQKATELGIILSDAILNVGLTIAGFASPLFTTTVQDEIRERAVAGMQRVALESYSFTIDGRFYTTGSLVNEFRDRVITDLSQGTKVIFVAHSQGNFFANSTRIAVNGATPEALQRGLAVVNVANATLSAPSDLYITSRQDLIIGALIRLNLALPANTDAGLGSLLNSGGHAFVDVYLSRDLPGGTPVEDSMSGRLTRLIQQALTTTPSPEGSILGSTSRTLFRISLTTLTAQSLGSFTTSGSGLTPVFDIAINPRGGQAIALSPNALSSFDPGIRLLTRLPQSNLGGNALSFNADGELFAMSGNTVYRVDATTGVATPLPSSASLGAYSSSGDLTFDSDGVLWGTVTGTNGRDTLVRIDPARATVTFAESETGFSGVWGLYFSGGILYGATSDGQLITINRSTGVGTFSSNLGIGDITGLQ